MFQPLHKYIAYDQFALYTLKFSRRRSVFRQFLLKTKPLENERRWNESPSCTHAAHRCNFVPLSWLVMTPTGCFSRAFWTADKAVSSTFKILVACSLIIVSNLCKNCKKFSLILLVETFCPCHKCRFSLAQRFQGDTKWIHSTIYPPPPPHFLLSIKL
jgi:hypothetical protein